MRPPHRDRFQREVAIFATLLENDPRLCAGLFAVALARQGVKLGWPATWQALIRRLRGHPLPDVRAAALEITMAPE